jgi:tetratricopeptide (TPR) repeat protein
MRRFVAVSASFLFLASLFLGCGGSNAKKDDDRTDLKPIVKVDPPKPKEKDKEKEKDKVDPPEFKVEDEKQEKYQAALGDAIRALANRQWDDAMTAFKAAQAIDDTEFVKSEIARLQQQMDQDASAKSTVKNIESVLNDGDAEEAIRLLAVALKEFGGGDDAAKLVLLRLQADALKDAQKKEPDDARFTRYRDEAEKALGENNLRAAVLAMELALQFKNDAGVKEKYDVKVKDLEKYDSLRKKAAELRRDPLQLDEAQAALEEAAKAWDTPQVRAEIDDCALARSKRRDTVSVVNFDVRNDVGMPDAGAALADELLPKLKPKFDLVEREMVSKIIEELKLERGFADDPKQQQQLGSLAKVRYLVFGSVSRKVGVTVRARLVDVRTGLVVQTAKLETRDMRSALLEMPKIAKQLMSDEFDAPQAVAQAPEVAPDKDEFPKIDDPAPKQELNVDVPPPAFGAMKRDNFKVLAPAPADFVAPEAKPWVDPRRKRLLFASVEMGDFLFRAGRFGEAQRQFEFALALDPGNVQIQLRLQNVRPMAPPVVVVGGPVFAPRPRLAVLPFVVEGDPRVVPPSLSYWTPANLAPYFSTRYEIVDPGEIYWYMGRMGLTMQDLLVDPYARRWLGRAVGVRYFVFGAHYQTASFNVNTYLLDVETGYLQGAASIHVHNPHELRFRLQELAALTMMTPAERAAYFAMIQQQRYVDAVAAGRRFMAEGRYLQALEQFDIALSINPNDVLVRSWRFLCAERVRFLNFERERIARFEAQQAAVAAAKARQAALARQTEEARRRALADAAARTPAQKEVYVNLRFKARDSMITQAQVALKTNQFGISVNLYQGAMDVGAVVGAPPPPPVAPDIYQDFARAKLGAERNAKLREETLLRKVREAELAKTQQDLADAQKKLEAERAAAKANLDKVRADQLARDKQAYDAGVKQGLKHMGDQNYAAALAAFQGAQRVAHGPKETETINAYIATIVDRQALKAGKTQKDLDAERDRRLAAEAKAKENEALYKAALKEAQQALAQKKFELAEAKFKQAQLIFKTDAVESGLRQLKIAQDALAAEIAKKAAEDQKKLQVASLLKDGKALLDAKKYDQALKVFQNAKKLAPEDLEVLAGLAQAQAGAPRPKIDPVDPTPKSKLQDLITAGQNALKLKDYDAAEKALRAASALDAKNPAVVQGLKDIAQARKALANTKQIELDYTEALGAGQKALVGKNYAAAIKSFQEALNLKPKDPTAQSFLQKAQDAQGLAVRTANYDQAIVAGQKAMKAKNYDVAVKSFQQALEYMPKDANAQKLLQQARDAQTAAASAAANFQKAINLGQAALKAKNYDVAIKAFTEATKIDPFDADAKKFLAQAEQGRTVFNYDKAMTAGNNAMSAKRFKDAIAAYNDALDWIPKDKKATQQLQLAQQALKDATPPKVDPNKQYAEAMQRGVTLNKDKKYAEAVKAYDEALKLRPKDGNATNGKRQNQYLLHLQLGQQYLDNAQWMAAQNEFEAAIALFPTDQAKKLLEKAKKKMK